jgi:hypothetical protein
MAFFDYRKVRLLILAVTGFMPLFFMTLAMGGLKLSWIGGAASGLAVLAVLLAQSYAIHLELNELEAKKRKRKNT